MSSLLSDIGFIKGLNIRKENNTYNAIDYFVFSRFNKENKTKQLRSILGLSGYDCLAKNIYKPHGLPISFDINGNPKRSPLHNTINIVEHPSPSPSLTELDWIIDGQYQHWEFVMEFS
jgi:hypothetical protein